MLLYFRWLTENNMSRTCCELRGSFIFLTCERNLLSSLWCSPESPILPSSWFSDGSLSENKRNIKTENRAINIGLPSFSNEWKLQISLHRWRNIIKSMKRTFLWSHIGEQKQKLKNPELFPPHKWRKWLQWILNNWYFPSARGQCSFHQASTRLTA